MVREKISPGKPQLYDTKDTCLQFKSSCFLLKDMCLFNRNAGKIIRIIN
jgi:hypothetical protein